MRLEVSIASHSKTIAASVLGIESGSLRTWLAVLFHETINANVYLRYPLFLIENLSVFSRNFSILLLDGLLLLLNHFIHLCKLFFLSFEFLGQFCFSGCLALALRIWNLFTLLFELSDWFLLSFIALEGLYILLETTAFVFWSANQHSLESLVQGWVWIWSRLNVLVNSLFIFFLYYLSTFGYLNDLLKLQLWISFLSSTLLCWTMTLQSLYILFETAFFVFWSANQHSFESLVQGWVWILSRLDVLLNSHFIFILDCFSFFS